VSKMPPVRAPPGMCARWRVVTACLGGRQARLAARKNSLLQTHTHLIISRLYTMRKSGWLIFFLLNTAVLSAQKIPDHKSQTDKQGKRQGHWIIWYDNEWNETTTLNAVKFYRSIHYKDDVPAKTVTDFYANGNKQMEGVLLQDRPKPVYDGWISFYYENGQERLRVKNDQGKFANEYFAFRRDGSAVTLPWTEPAKQAENETDPAKRISLLQVALENAEALFSSKSTQYAEQSEALAYEYFLTDQYREALDAFQTSLTIYKKQLPPADVKIADAQYFLSVCYFYLKDNPAQKTILLELLENIDTNHQGKYVSLINVLSSLGSIYENDPQKSYAYLLRGYELLKETATTEENYQSRISMLYNLQSTLFDIQDWNKALEVNDFALMLVESLEGKSSEHYINTLNTRAAFERNLGQGKNASQSANQQFELALKTFGKNDVNYAEALVSKAGYEDDRGNFAEAEKMLLEAKAIYTTTNQTAKPNYGTLLNSLISLYHSLGNEAKESEVDEEYKNVIIKNEGFNSHGFVSYIQSRSLHLIALKGYQVAEEALEISSKIIHKMDSMKSLAPEVITDLKGSNHSASAMLYMQMLQDINNVMVKKGTDAQRQQWVTTKEGLVEKIEFHLEESIALEQSTTKGLDTRSQLMLLKMFTGDLKGAEQEAIEMETHMKNLFGEDSPSYANVLTTRAQIIVPLEKYQMASDLYRKAFGHYKNYSNAVVPYLSETERQVFYNELNAKLQQYTAFMVNHQNKLKPEEKGNLLEAIMLNKSLGLNQLKDIRIKLEAANDKEGLQLLAKWKSKKEELIKLYQQEKTELIRQQEKLLENEVNELERSLASRSNDFNEAQTFSKSSWKDLQKALKPGEALVEILRTEIQRAVVDTSYVAVVLHYGEPFPYVVEIPNAIRLENKPLRYYQNAIRVQLEDRNSYNQFWLPIKSAVKSAKKIYVSPDGLYNQVNLESLLNPETGKYLIDEVSIEIITSSRQMLAKNKQAPVKEVVMIGNPDFGGTVPSPKKKEDFDKLNRAFDADNVIDLPGTKTEIEGVSQLLNLSNIEHKSFTQIDASEETVRKLQSPQVLHLATHGFFLSDIVKEGDNSTIMGFEQKKLIENPMLRSGLLLAGCRNGMKNRNSNATSSGDGVLTAYEVSNLSLTNTQLVVMSACETGLGKIMNGEGVIGLPRAFLSAGANQVLMSLWKVDDEATQEIMRTFYKNWIALGDMQLAWRKAQQGLREKYPQPYYWGAFVMMH
jgi:CHAT domain-containing protein